MTSTTADAADVRPADADPPGGAETRAPGAGAGSPRSFCPLPPPLDPASRRRHRIVLALLMLAGLAVGTYWTFTTVVWSPVDEVAHYGYVESLATGEGIPTVGVDLISDEAIASLKESRTLIFRSNPYRPVSSDENWGGTREQYEAVQGPTYYLLMVPAYWIGQPFGALGSLYAMRFATVALVLLAVPLTWMLARRLFPDRPAVWLLAPALLVTVNSLSPGSITNDALVLVLSIITIVAFLRALDAWSRTRRDPDEPTRDRPCSWVLAAGAGALFGLTIVTKMTSLVLIPFLATAFVAWVITRRPTILTIVRFVAFVVAGAVVAFGPWLAWNLVTYGSTSAATVVDGITGSSLPTSTLSVAAIVQHASVARSGVWVNQLLEGGAYQTVWEILIVAALVLGAAAAAVRRRWRDLAVVLWCGAAIPFAFASMEVIVFVLFDGTGGPMGRHLIAAMAPTIVMVAAAAVLVVGARWAPPLVAALITATLVAQVGVARQFTGVYTRSALDDRLAPVRYQDWSDMVRDDATAITIDVNCPVEVIGIGFIGEPAGTGPGSIPQIIQVRDATVATGAGGGGEVDYIPGYRLLEPVTGRITIDVPPGSIIRTASGDRDPDVGYTSGEGDPVATAYCATDDAQQAAFSVMYSVGHPDSISLATLQTIPVLFAAIGAVVTLGLGAAAVRSEVRARGGASRPSGPSASSAA